MNEKPGVSELSIDSNTNISDLLTARGIREETAPFIAGKPILSNKYFIGREELVADVQAKALANGVVLIEGGTRSGKTSLAHHVAQKLIEAGSADGKPISFDYSAYTTSTSEQILEEIEEEKNENKSLRPVVVFDEFDFFLSNNPDEASRLLDELEKLKRQSYTFIIISQDDIGRTTRQERESKIKSGNKKSLQTLVGDSVAIMKLCTRDDIRKIVAGGETPLFTDKVIEFLIAESGGHPLWAQLLASTMFRVTKHVQAGHIKMEELLNKFKAILEDNAPNFFADTVQNMIEAGYDPLSFRYGGSHPEPNSELYMNMLPSFDAKLFRDWLSDHLKRIRVEKRLADYVTTGEPMGITYLLANAAKYPEDFLTEAGRKALSSQYIAGRPLQPSEFIGREDLVEDALAKVSANHVVTLTGSYRSGKTSLSYKLADVLQKQGKVDGAIRVSLDIYNSESAQEIFDKIGQNIEERKLKTAVVVVDEPLTYEFKKPEEFRKLIDLLARLKNQGHYLIFTSLGDLKSETEIKEELSQESKAKMLELVDGSITAMRLCNDEDIRRIICVGEQPLFQENAINALIAEAGGQPLLANLFAQRLLGLLQSVLLDGGQRQKTNKLVSKLISYLNVNLSGIFWPVVKQVYLAGYDPKSGEYVSKLPRPNDVIYQNMLPRKTAFLFYDWLKKHKVDSY